MNRVEAKLLGVVLCGGRSRRMGRDKADLATTVGSTFLDHAVERLQAICEKVSVSANATRQMTHDLIPDPDPSFGPISGVHTSLLHAANEGFDGCLINPVDTPNLTTKDLKQLISAFNDDPVSVAHAYATEGDVQPLIAIYPVTVIETLERWITDGRYSLRRNLAELDCRRVALSPEACRNLNTPDDLTELGSV